MSRENALWIGGVSFSKQNKKYCSWNKKKFIRFDGNFAGFAIFLRFFLAIFVLLLFSFYSWKNT